MKLFVVPSIASVVVARLQGGEHHSRSAHHHQLALPPKEPTPIFYGDSRCPCIGFDNIEGETVLELPVDDGEKMGVAYPADLGARCEAWDDNTHPQCKKGAEPGAGKDWCGQKWCYVDPCRCEIDVLPKITIFQPEATYRGKPLFWSYATCGGRDEFTKKIPQLGNPKCRCIGFAGIAGTTEISFKDGEMVEYPADLGSTCQAWDHKKHPECKGDKAPSWCRANWCYVDPCECELVGSVVPKISLYLPEATFTGKNLYYSYETCGNPDTFTEDNHPHACVNQETKEECGEHPRCSWTGERCLGSELVNHPLCKEAADRILTDKEKEEENRAGSDSVSLSLFGMALAAATWTATVHA